AVLLARSASPAFAAGLGWGAWERALRIGQEAARIAGEVAEEAYFHHELGVLALCTGNPDRARTELETSIGMRGALADKSGAVAGRRALALVADRSGDFAPIGRTSSGDEVPMV
ncbi:ATP-binding protein, partial [Streptomyces anulatus]|nr:ATP-binding protein [Streptomyces anulatus]